jgi:hypothetical protein
MDGTGAGSALYVLAQPGGWQGVAQRSAERNSLMLEGDKLLEFKLWPGGLGMYGAPKRATVSTAGLVN